MQSTSGCFNKRLLLKGSNFLVTISPPGVRLRSQTSYTTSRHIVLSIYQISQHCNPHFLLCDRKRALRRYKTVLLRPSCMFMMFYDKFCPSRGFRMTFYINYRNVHVHMNDGWEDDDARFFLGAGQGGEVL